MENKKFVLHCEICDARKLKEGILDEFDSVTINTEILIVNERSREILNRACAVMNVEETVEVGDDVNLIVKTGSCEIGSGDMNTGKALLLVNGHLEIQAGAMEALQNYVKIFVNGSIRYPDTMRPYVGSIQVNGQTESYPAECTLLKPTTFIDKYFVLRARENAGYYASDKVVMTEPGLDVASLAAKGVHFVTGELVITEQKLPDALSMFSETTELLVLPENCGYVSGDAVLDHAFYARYGNCFHVDGNLRLDGQSAEWIDKLDYVKVRGEVILPESLKEAFIKTGAEYGGLKFEKGRTISNGSSVKVDQAMLTACPEGLLIQNYGCVTIADDVSAGEIRDLLQITNCARICCSPGQIGVLELVSSNVAYIGEAKDGDCADAMRRKDTPGFHIVNAETYIL